MNIVVSGGTGFLGRPLIHLLLEKNHAVTVLTRNPDSVREVKHGRLNIQQWDGKTVGTWAQKIESCDAVINLAGESIGGGRWTARRKERILSSRVDATRALVAAIAQAKKKPSVFVSASAVGYYGHVVEGDVPESHPRGNDFLADVCERWEQEARAAERHGVRVVNPRFGVVLEKDGGALKKLLLPFKLFFGGPLGSGRQWFPWVHRSDVLESILFALQNDRLRGPMNVAAPDPVTMKKFCKALGKAMHRPSWAPVPSFVLRLLLGEMSSIVLTGQRVIPKKLQEAGYTFRFPKLHQALSAIFAD